MGCIKLITMPRSCRKSSQSTFPYRRLESILCTTLTPLASDNMRMELIELYSTLINTDYLVFLDSSLIEVSDGS
jgi:hypothetical protein